MTRTVLVSAGLFLGALASSSGLSAQMTLGLGGGVVSSTLTGEDVEGEIESQTGISVGAFLSIPIGGRIAIVPGGHYVQKGASATEFGETLTFNISYFEIPLLLSLGLTPSDTPIGFSIFAGPAFAFEVGCTVDFSDGTTSDSDDCDPADDDDRQTFDVGGVVGATVQFPLGDRLALAVTGGADIGLRTLDTSTDPDDIRSRAFFGSVALAIPLSY